MKSLLFCSLLFAGAATVPAAERSFNTFCASCGIGGADTFVSHSKQFVVHGSAAPKLRYWDGNTNSLQLINLEPQIFAITAERAKRAFLQELLAEDRYHDKIHAIIMDRVPPDRPVQLVSEVYPDGFTYRIGLPGKIEHTRLIRGLVQALLLDYSNRGSIRCVELPRWLIEGMTQQILSSVVPTYVLNESQSLVDIVGYDRLSYTRAYLSTNEPMSVQELSFYNGAPADEPRFAACAHMFVHELLRLKRGPALMSAFLRSLPAALNWQTAFYHVYQAEFTGPLSVEKWWMLAWSDEKNRLGRETWPLDLSLTRLNSLLGTSMETRVSTNSVPQRRESTLQEVITQTDFAIQRAIFSQKVQALFFASVNLSPAVLPLAQAYQETLESYVQKRAINQYQPGLKYDPAQRVQGLVQATLQRLDELDRAREDVKEGRPVTTRALAKRR